METKVFPAVKRLTEEDVNKENVSTARALDAGQENSTDELQTRLAPRRTDGAPSRKSGGHTGARKESVTKITRAQFSASGNGFGRSLF